MQHCITGDLYSSFCSLILFLISSIATCAKRKLFSWLIGWLVLSLGSYLVGLRGGIGSWCFLIF